jgi:hypothetical protein
MQDPYARQKCDQLRTMLDDGLVMIHLDPRPADVIVPPQFKSQPMLRLNLAWGFNLPALDIDERGVYAVLSFNRVNFGCTIPWSAIFAMTWPDQEHDGYVWPDCAPPELQAAFASLPAARAGGRPTGPRAAAQPQLAESTAETAEAPEMPETAEAPPSAPRPRPLLVVRDGGRQETSTPDDEPAPSTSPPTERPRLRLVKG